MPDIVVSPNMNLSIPVVGQDPGPDWADNLNNCLTLIDAHNHSPGFGVPVTPAGLNINATVDFQDNNAIGLMSARFQSQSSPLGGLSDLDCLYVATGNLFYNDGSGNQIQITSGGGIVGAPGNITGLVPPAAVTYSPISQTFTFTAMANTPANLDAGFIKLRNNVAFSNAVTLFPPASMASNFTLTLPTLPSVQSFMTLDNTGLMAAPWVLDNVSLEVAGGTTIQIKDNGVTTPKIVDAAVTRPKLAAVGQQISLSCGSFSTSSGTAVVVQDQTVTITTTGRPVMISWQATQPVIPPQSSSIALAAGNAAIIFVERDSAPIISWLIDPPDYAPSFLFLDPVSAGTHTYTVKAFISSGSATLSITSFQLAAYEL